MFTSIKGVTDLKLKLKVKWLRNPCLLRVSNMERNDMGWLTWLIAPKG